MRKGFLSILFTLSFLALSCGGGNITIILFPDDDDHEYEDEASITISRFGVSPAILSVGITFIVEWSAGWREAPNADRRGYFAELVAYHQPYLPANYQNYRIATVYCDLECSNWGRLVCDITANYKLSCRTQIGRVINSYLPLRGNGYLILKACTYNYIGQACDTKSVAVEVR